jgi:DNA-binding response OmpR family regulator
MRNILIADDSVELTDILRSIYSRRNIFITTALSRDEVLSVLTRISPDLILLDVFLGEDDGRLLCKELKSSVAYNKIPIILMSGNPKTLENHRDVNADAILEKPFTLETVLSTIKAVTSNAG